MPELFEGAPTATRRMTRAIRYRDPRRPDVAGLAITKKEQVEAEAARLKEAGYVVIEIAPVKPGKI